MTENKYTLLTNINYPSDIKKLNINQLPQLCDELRHFIIEQLANNPGHLGSSLGVVELAVAIHYVFDTPHDRIIWDVGHQAYPHKILTGRRPSERTDTISMLPAHGRCVTYLLRRQSNGSSTNSRLKTKTEM